MIPDAHAGFGGERLQARRQAHERGRGDDFHAKRLAHLEDAREFIVREVGGEWQVVRRQGHAGVIEALLDVLRIRDRALEPPLPGGLAAVAALGNRNAFGPLHVTGPEFAVGQADLLHPRDRLVQTPIAETVALRSHAHARNARGLCPGALHVAGPDQAASDDSTELASRVSHAPFDLRTSPFELRSYNE